LLPESKTFRLSWHYRWIIVPIVWIGATVWLVDSLIGYAGLMRNGAKMVLWAILADLPGIALASFIWYKWLTMPLTIVVDQDGTLTLKGILRKVEIAIGDIIRVERKLFWEKVFSRYRTFYISNLMEKNSEILPALKAHNPDIETVNTG
jgi:hypothetical protein